MPNLSTRQNEINFGAYLLGNIEFDDIFAACKESDNYERERIDNIPLCLPVAVRTSRLNARIQTQSGTFVAFNLYTLPEISKQRQRGNQAFDYISLEEVQKEMNGMLRREEKPKRKRKKGIEKKPSALFLRYEQRAIRICKGQGYRAWRHDFHAAFLERTLSYFPSWGQQDLSNPQREGKAAHKRPCRGGKGRDKVYGELCLSISGYLWRKGLGKKRIPFMYGRVLQEYGRQIFSGPCA